MEQTLHNKIEKIIEFIKKNANSIHCNDQFNLIQAKYKIWLLDEYMVFKLTKHTKYLYIENIIRNTESVYLGFNIIKFDTVNKKIVEIFDFQEKYINKALKHFEPIFQKDELEKILDKKDTGSAPKKKNKI